MLVTQRITVFKELIKYKSMTYGVKDAPRFGRFYSFRSLEDLDDVLYDKAVKVISTQKK